MVKAIFGSLIGMLLLILVMFGRLIFNSDDQFVSNEINREPQYHIQVIVQNSNENFWKHLKEGASDAAKELNVFVEFVPITQKDAVTINTAVEKGIYANVDGIALQATERETVDMIKEYTDNGKKIVAFENFYYNITNLPHVPIIGSNSYYIGYDAGEMAIEATNGKAEVGLILNDANISGNEGYNNSIVQGILQAFSLYGNINLSADHIFPLDTGMFESEKLESEVLPHAKELDILICTDDKITPSVAQMLYDNNLVKDIGIIGYGDRNQTLDYISRGTIYGAISPDSYKIGYYTVKQLVDKIEDKPISYFKMIDLKHINSSNWEQFMTDEE